MRVLIPMNGTGERFRKANYPVPKPFLPLKGKMLIQHVLDQFPEEWEVRILARGEYLPYFDSLQERYREDALFLHSNTEGPLDTVLYADRVASNDLLDDSEILIADCDAFMSSRELLSGVEAFRNGSVAGGTWMRKTTDPMCAYAQVENGKVLEVREKDPFTEISLTGPYWWSAGSLFSAFARQMLFEENRAIAPVYNLALRGGLKVMAVETETFVHAGDPSAYEALMRRSDL